MIIKVYVFSDNFVTKQSGSYLDPKIIQKRMILGWSRHKDLLPPDWTFSSSGGHSILKISK